MNYFLGLAFLCSLLLILEWFTFNSKVNSKSIGDDVKVEPFYNPWDRLFHPYWSSNIGLPYNRGLPYFWASTGTTRNMSYDIRGDPYIPYTGAGQGLVNTSPWYQSTIRPIRNRQMILI